MSDQKANVGLINHEDTKSTKFCLGSVPVPRFVFFVPSWLFPSPHEPADAVFEPRYVEVDQKPDTHPGQLQVSDQLRLMNGFDRGAALPIRIFDICESEDANRVDATGTSKYTHHANGQLPP